MIDVQVEGAKLIIDDNQVRFANAIAKVLEFDDFVVVLLDLTGVNYPGIDQNVLAVESDGSIRWRIDKAPDKTGGGHDAYSGIWEDDGELWAYNLNGMGYLVSKDDGSIIDGKFMK